MNKIEQIHYYSGCFESREIAAIKSAEITSQIAVEFAEWMANNHVSMSTKRRDSEQFFYQGKEINTKDLFQQFLKTKQ